MRITDATLEKRSENLVVPDEDASIVERIKYLILFMKKTQVQFAKLIKVDPSNLSRFMTGRAQVTERLINSIAAELGVSKEWLVNGTDVPFPRIPEVNIPSISEGEHVTLQNQGAPVYDIDVAAGTAELSRMFTEDRIVGRLNMPQLSYDTPIVHVSGDSMAPRIPNGSYIAIRPINITAPICWGQVYVVVTEDYRLVKVVKRHHNPDMVILHSFNDMYDDMEIPRASINFLYMVTAVLSYDILG
jgi:phage repressor protein C with HTH and peptisase S24 domain